MHLGFSQKDENLIRELKCDRSWPFCIFDFTAMATINEFFVFRVRSPKPRPKSLPKSHIIDLDKQ